MTEAVLDPAGAPMVARRAAHPDGGRQAVGNVVMVATQPQTPASSSSGAWGV
jgi:hypothetical protein